MQVQDRRQLRTIQDAIRLVIPLTVMWSLGVGVMAYVGNQTEDRAGELLMDPSFSIGSAWYTGLVSNLGILTWTVAAFAAFGGAWMCSLGGRDSARRFLIGGGLVGSVMLLDDLFQFHAILLPGELGIPKMLCQALIGIGVAGWIITQRHQIRRTHVHVLLASFGALGISFLIDSKVGPAPGEGWNIIEDGAKFLGVLAWATYFVVTTADISRSVFRDALLTWPDEAYDSVYGALEEAATVPAS